MPTIQANGCDFYYELEGQGPELVFIHGEIHGLEYWEHQIPEFARDHRCFAYNRRGHAKTGPTNYGFSLVNQTRDLAQLIEHFGMERPVIIAVAFGTTIAANYAIQYPERVRGVVLAAWSEMHEAMQYFQRWEKYNERAADVLESRGRDALISLLRDEGGKTIYRVIPLELAVAREGDPDVRESSARGVSPRNARVWILGAGSRPGLSPARSAGAGRVRRERSVSR